MAIKRGLGRVDFKVDARLLRWGLLDNGYSELPIISDHIVATDSLPLKTLAADRPQELGRDLSHGFEHLPDALF